MKKANLKQKVYKYIAVFEPDDARGGYTVTIPALPGCISEGDTFEKALANIKEAAKLYLEVMKKEDNQISSQDAIVAPIQIQF